VCSKTTSQSFFSNFKASANYRIWIPRVIINAI
jgi:hypothetical protein